ncbi:MAG: amidohydrolase family protein [Phycisphaerales bacterium JB054]
MLCRIAEEFGFTIGTFQHGLEVYKVAEAVRENAIGASLFSDWWAYKVEVQDAIAQAGPLQTEAGVLTSYNSDSDELSRRMHVEAGKAYKYSNGRISKEDALKFVTINPAIQLGVGDRIGSIEVGKDADLAVWSGEPLSSFSMCEATWIDGREYFSLERDAALREQNAEHRKRITQKILTKGAPKAKPKSGDADEPEDDTEEDNMTDDDPPRSLRDRMLAAARTQHYMNLYLRGINPADHQCGDCGATELQFGGNR